MLWRWPSPTRISPAEEYFCEAVASIQVSIPFCDYRDRQDGARVDIHLYGIPNCDTVKRARAWLEAHGHAHAFHDYKREGVDPARLAAWADRAGWALLLNTRGATFRQLSDEDRAGIDGAKALALMAAHPSLIKRPVVEHPGGLLVGFDPDRWSKAFA